jgi:hypothetical protein
MRAHGACGTRQVRQIRTVAAAGVGQHVHAAARTLDVLPSAGGAMMLHTVLYLGLSLLGAPPETAPADVLIRIAGPLSIAREAGVRTAIVINADAVIDGTVHDQLVVINGTARVRGSLQGGATIINGRLVLERAARVDGNIALYRGELERDPGALVSGRVLYEVVPTYRQVAWLLWVATTLVLVLAALAYTFLARPQLTRAAELMRRQPARVAVATLILVLGIPSLALVAVLTGVGVPIAFTLIVFVLPVLAFLGYVITGTSIGQLLTRMEPRLRNPYVAATLGILVLQLLAAVPPAGALFVVFATQLGAGALAYYVWRQHRPETAAAG